MGAITLIASAFSGFLCYPEGCRHGYCSQSGY